MAKHEHGAGGGPFEVEPGRPFAPSGEGDTADDARDDIGEAAYTSPEAPPIGDELGEPIELVPEATVRSLLQAQGALVHSTIAVEASSDEWVWLAHELDTIVPPLTRIVNRYDVLRRAAVAGDPLAVAVALGAYGRRSIEQRAIDQATLAAAYGAEPTGDVAFHYDPAGGGAGDEPPPQPPPAAPAATVVPAEVVEGLEPVRPPEAG